MSGSSKPVACPPIIYGPLRYCVFRPIVTDHFGSVTADFGIVTGHFGIVTEAIQ
jgi:hypothetical protein